MKKQPTTIIHTQSQVFIYSIYKYKYINATNTLSFFITMAHQIR